MWLKNNLVLLSQQGVVCGISNKVTKVKVKVS